MSEKSKYPVTPGVRFLRAAKVDYTEHLYEYEERGGTDNLKIRS